MVETVFPNLVVTRAVPKGPQTRGKVRGKCKQIGEALPDASAARVIKGSFFSLCFLTASNIRRYQFITADCCLAAPWESAVDDCSFKLPSGGKCRRRCP